MNYNDLNLGESTVDLITFLKEKKFELSNIGITYKQAYDWRTAGLYLQDKLRKYRMKYSPIEYIWTLLIQEARLFGLSYQAIRKMKEFLLLPIGIDELLNIETTKQQTSYETKLTASKEVLGEQIVDSFFTSMLYSTFKGEQQYYLLITKNGECSFHTNNETSPLYDQSYLTIPLSNLVLNFINKEKITAFEKKVDLHKSAVTEQLDLSGSVNISNSVKSTLEKLLTETETGQIQYLSKDGKRIQISVKDK